MRCGSKLTYSSSTFKFRTGRRRAAAGDYVSWAKTTSVRGEDSVQFVGERLFPQAAAAAAISFSPLLQPPPTRFFSPTSLLPPIPILHRQSNTTTTRLLASRILSLRPLVRSSSRALSPPPFACKESLHTRECFDDVRLSPSPPKKKKKLDEDPSAAVSAQVSKNALDVWGLDKESALHKFFVGEPMGTIAASPDGHFFAAGSLTGEADQTSRRIPPRDQPGPTAPPLTTPTDVEGHWPHTPPHDQTRPPLSLSLFLSLVSSRADEVND